MSRAELRRQERSQKKDRKKAETLLKTELFREQEKKMSRAELRRQERSQKKDRKKAETLLKQAGFPAFQMPPAPMRTSNLSVQEVANLTGAKVAVLEQWRREQTEEIKKSVYCGSTGEA